MIDLTITPGLWMFIIIVAAFLDYLIGDIKPLFHPDYLILQLTSLLKKIFNRGRDPRVKGLLLWFCIQFIVLGILIFLVNVASKINVYLFIILSLWLLSCTLSEKSLYMFSYNMTEDLDNNDLDEAKQLLKKYDNRNSTKLLRQDVIKATLEVEVKTGVNGIIGPIFYMLIGILTSMMLPIINPIILVFFYKVTVLIPTQLPNYRKEYSEFCYYPEKLYLFFNFIPFILSSYLILLSGAILGYDYKLAYLRFRSDEPLFYAMRYTAPFIAFACTLGIQLGGPIIYYNQTYQNPILGKGEYRIRPEDIDDGMNLILSSELLLLIISILVISLCYLISSLV